MLKLSASQVKGIQAMGDMGIKGKFGVWMALPPVNGRSLTVLERLGAVERRESDGMWRLTIAGVTEYNRIAGEECIVIGNEIVEKQAAEVLFSRNINDSARYESERARLLDMIGILYPKGPAPYRVFDFWLNSGIVTIDLAVKALMRRDATEAKANDAAARFAEVMTSLEKDAPITEESVSWQAVRVHDAVMFDNGTYETERARLLDMLGTLYPTVAPYRIFDAWWGTMLTIVETAHMLTEESVTDHGFSGHSRRPVECRTCGRHASQHAAYVPNDGSSEAMWRQVAPETAQSVGTPWKASKGKYGRHSKAWRG